MRYGGEALECRDVDAQRLRVDREHGPGGVVVRDSRPRFRRFNAGRTRRLLMDLVPYFVERHANIHGMNARRLFSELDDAGLRARPQPDLNSVAWCVWHMARCEDVGVNPVVRGTPQSSTSASGPRR